MQDTSSCKSKSSPNEITNGENLPTALSPSTWKAYKKFKFQIEILLQ